MAVEVQVDRGSVAGGQAEHHVEVGLRVALGSRVEPADDGGTGLQRLVQQLGGARQRQQPVLGEGHLLHVHRVSHLVRELGHRQHPAQADLGVDVGVRPERRRPGAGHRVDQRAHRLRVRDPELRTPTAVVLDPRRQVVRGQV